MELGPKLWISLIWRDPIQEIETTDVVHKDVSMRETLMEGLRHSFRHKAWDSDRGQDEDRLRNAGIEQSSSILRSKNQTDRNETSDTENARGRSATRPEDDARFIEVQRQEEKVEK